MIIKEIIKEIIKWKLIGINESNRAAVAKELKKRLEASYTLYLQTHNFLLECARYSIPWLTFVIWGTVYRIGRSYGWGCRAYTCAWCEYARTYRSFGELSVIKQAENIPSAEDMLLLLIQSDKPVVRTCRQALTVALEAHDESSISLIWQNGYSWKNYLNVTCTSELITL